MKKRQNPTDSSLINQYISGNTNVLPVLVKRYHQEFCKKAFWVTKNKELAKDIAQESWLAIIDKIHTLKNTNSFRSWALRIVYTKAIDAIKQANKANNRLKSIVSNQDEEVEEDPKTKIKKALRHAINKLPKQKQDIIRLFYVEEYSITEISSFLNIPIGTVKSRLFKAREKLKSILKELNYEK